MKVLFLHRYSDKAASFRYRFSQYYPELARSGFDITSHSLLSDDYLKNKFERRENNTLLILRSYWRRLLFLRNLKRYDLAVIFLETFPYLPFFIEYFLILRRIPYLLDIDDAVYLRYERHGNFLVRLLLGNKYKKIFSHAAGILAGNSYLKNHALKYNPSVTVLPTVVDMKIYHSAKNFLHRSNKLLTVGWIGSPSTAKSLLSISSALSAVVEKYDVQLLFVGTGPLPHFAKKMTLRDWTLSGEVSDILDMDIGIMPLENTAWNEGKCGFKLIQYMACGLPVVGSPVGVNKEIIDHGRNGYLASTQEEWIQALSNLIEQPDKLASFGSAGRQKITNTYSLQAALPTLKKALSIQTLDWKSHWQQTTDQR